jgi:hypothetical protein
LFLIRIGVIIPHGPATKDAEIMTESRIRLKIADYLRCLGLRSVGLILLKRIFFVHHVSVLKLNLKTFTPRSFERPPAGTFFPLTADDVRGLLSAVPALPEPDRRELMARIRFYELGFTRLYGVRVDGEIAYIQWLVTPEDNPVIRDRYRRVFFELKPGHAMLENVFVFPRYRGLGYLPFVSQRLLIQARDDGFRTAVLYIREDKLSTLNEFVAMGFRFANLLRITQAFGFVHRRLLLPRL